MEAGERSESSTNTGAKSGMVDAHLFGLPSQPSVYTLCRLCTVVGAGPGANRLLVASLQRKVFSFEYVQGLEPGLLVPTAKELPFTYIPSGAQIIAIDAFNKSQTSNDFVIGITIIKGGDTEPSSHYLNIYTDWESGSHLELERVAQSCLSLELDFLPYHLFHSLWRQEYVWLLSGSDRMLHVFREDPANHRYQEVSARDLFPEFVHQMPSVVLWMDMRMQAGRRLSAVGCECGALQVFQVDLSSNTMTERWEVQHSGPITSVRLFELSTCQQRPSFLPMWKTSKTPQPSSPLSQEGRQEKEEAIPQVNLLVTNSLEPSCVYSHLMSKGLSCVAALPDSDKFDTVLCSSLADVDMDGRQEILLGTYGQELLVYHWSRSDGWKLSWQRSFANPILSLDYVDITGDVLNEFVVLTTRGLQILQHNPGDVCQLLLKRLEQVELRSGNKDADKQ